MYWVEHASVEQLSGKRPRLENPRQFSTIKIGIDTISSWY